MSATLWLLAGPPFATPIYRGTLARLAATRPDLRVEAVSVVEAGASPKAAAAALAQRVAPGDVVVAHALAVPVGIEIAHARSVARLVLLNGPLVSLDPLTAAVVRLASLPGAADTVFQPLPWLGWLRSSIGLRRAVNNPYAMDHDTVAALCGPLVLDRAARVALVTWLRPLGDGWANPATVASPLTLFWGDNDRIHPLAEPDLVDAQRGGGTIRVAPGGRFAWPEELPWALADALAAWMPKPSANSRTDDTSPSTTPVSQDDGGLPMKRGRRTAKPQVGG